MTPDFLPGDETICIGCEKEFTLKLFETEIIKGLCPGCYQKGIVHSAQEYHKKLKADEEKKAQIEAQMEDQENPPPTSL